MMEDSKKQDGTGIFRPVFLNYMSKYTMNNFSVFYVFFVTYL